MLETQRRQNRPLYTNTAGSAVMPNKYRSFSQDTEILPNHCDQKSSLDLDRFKHVIKKGIKAGMKDA